MDIVTVLWMFAALIVLVIVYYFINRKGIQAEEMKEKKLQERFNQSMNMPPPPVTRKSSPQVLQAYERLMILIDRISVQKLVQRVQPISTDKKDYADFLMKHVEQEFDFNTSQELYVSKEAWSVITAAKNAVIQDILKTTLHTEGDNAYDLQRNLLTNNSSQALISLVKNQLKDDVANLV